MPEPPISEHGLIGDLHTAALVSTRGTVDWLCLPRFDSPSVFASILDTDRGGRFSIASDDPECTVKQLYLPDTAILSTRFLSTSGVGEVIDFMPAVATGVDPGHRRLVRIVHVVRGAVRFLIRCDPRFDYGRQEHELHVTDGGAVFSTPELTLMLHGAGLERDGGGVRGTIELSAGQRVGYMLEADAQIGPVPVPNHILEDLFEQTRLFWRGWLGRSGYRGRWREMVDRSAITLKLLIHAPTGAPVAAPTAGLPEQLGGERNWDYRYTWVRDGSFSVAALLALGYRDEAGAFIHWLGDRIRERDGSANGPLQIMYRVDGSPELPEAELAHLSGHRGSRPVRIGNGAADQIQLDIYGEMMDAVYAADQAGLELDHATWVELARVVDWLCDNWDRPESGIWETRGGDQDFVYGRLMSWVAFDKGVRLAMSRGRPANLVRWLAERDAIYGQIMEKGFNAELGAFVQHYGSDVLDASLLKMPQVGFVAPHDPMWVSTLEAMDRTLVSDSLVYRYDPAASPDGLRGSEGTFSICTFWYVQALARCGRLRDARLVFEKMHGYANHLGLFSEEIGMTGDQLGNFPQAFTHLALIRAAVTLDRMLDTAIDQGGPGVAR
jgi:GH15 family glucan-1,4-alpha-glucosidase